jgi:CRP/FNR family transcriptional regulator, cyclic AMP receptor protein
MKTSRDLHVQYKCRECDQHSHGFLCQVLDADRKEFDSIKVSKVYPKGALLFIEGQHAGAVYMLCQGKVKLSTCSRDGKVIILDVVEAGDVLGLSAALNSTEYEATAEVLETCQINYIKTCDLLRFLQSNPEACLNAARQLSRNYQTAYRQVCSLGLSESVVDKLARLFLDWCGSGRREGSSIYLKNPFTHEDMAEMIGTSRETVTRTLKYFRDHGLITVRRSELVILDHRRLAEAVGTSRTVRNTV